MHVCCYSRYVFSKNKTQLTFCASTSTKPLVVFDLPALGVNRLLPFLKLWKSEESLCFLAFGALDDGCDELLQKAGDVQEGRPKVIVTESFKTVHSEFVFPDAPILYMCVEKCEGLGQDIFCPRPKSE